MIEYLDLDDLVLVTSVRYPLGHDPPEVFLHPLLGVLATRANRNVSRIFGQADLVLKLGDVDVDDRILY
jgi:hypothetical protein